MASCCVEGLVSSSREQLLGGQLCGFAAVFESEMLIHPVSIQNKPRLPLGHFCLARMSFLTISHSNVSHDRFRCSMSKYLARRVQVR